MAHVCALVWVSESPAPVNFALPQQIEGVKPDLLSGVTASGYARKVDVDAKTTFGQVLVQSVRQWDKKEFCVDAGDMLVFTAGCPPIHGRQTLYFEDPELRARSDIKMPSSLPEANTEDKIP